MSSPSPLQVPLSPCIGICTLDDAEYCMGCRRHIGEIAAWLRLGEDERRRILEELPSRSGSVARDGR